MTFDMDHIVINAIDIDKMVQFYTEVLQMPGERLEEFKNQEVPFPSVRLTKDTIIDLFPKQLWEIDSAQGAAHDVSPEARVYFQ